MIPARFATPSRISMSATESSMVRPSRGGITTPKTMIAPPTATMVRGWPMPQSTPISAAAPARRGGEGDDEHEAEAEPAGREGGQHHHQRRRAGEEPARHAEREETPPAERVRGEV